MRRAFLVLAMSMAALLRAAEGDAQALTPAQAAARLGSTVTVEFTVKGVGSNPAGFEELYSEPSWENPACFFLRFPKGAMAQLAERRIPGLHYFQGAVVQATGMVTEVNFGAAGRRTVIYVEDLAQFRALAASQPGYTPTAAYRELNVRGHVVLVHAEAQSRAAAFTAAMEELDVQLAKIQAAVPRAVLTALGKVRFWIEWDSRAAGRDGPGAATFHPSAAWLKANGHNPDKAGDVEITNIRNFVAWSRGGQPWMVLHEMAHAHHHLVLGAAHAGIRDAYAQAMERRLYESVAYVHGSARRAYAADNVFEYYAELSEAFFGRNDYYPFTRDELEKHDPAGFRLMQRTWGLD